MKYTNLYILIVLIIFWFFIIYSIGSIFKVNNLEKENELLRNELNIKNGKLWQHQIEQNMEKDQPIYF